MGTWGVALFSDDLAADLKGEFRELIGDGLSPEEAIERLCLTYTASLKDPDESPVFWLSLASASWKLGRLTDRTRMEAVRVIDSGEDLRRWSAPKDREKRELILFELRKGILSPQPPAVRVPRRVKNDNQWIVGEVLGFHLLSGDWTLFRVIGHHSDRGGKFAVYEPLDWVGEAFPTAAEIAGLPVKPRLKHPTHHAQFMLGDPKTKADQARVVRLNHLSVPSDKPRGFLITSWRFVDRQLKEVFGLS